MKRTAFTLVELLIVIAIIALLALIAIPNFLESQTRAKVSRAVADLRSIATAIEAYRTDYTSYPPNDGVYNVIPSQLSTPVAYVTQANLVDPFCDKERLSAPGFDPDLARFYTYTQVVSFSSFTELLKWVTAGNPNPWEGADCPNCNPGAMRRYGPWRLVSNGPDRVYSNGNRVAGPFNPNPLFLLGCDIPYDPTNGTYSIGNILRTHKSAKGLAP
jgi:prepilin-type N-terminal cleavage/methylation domain-containing protein